MSAIVLDASALIALLRVEPGADRVADILASARIGAVNYAEVVSHFVHAGIPGADVDDMLAALPIEIVPLDKDLARRAGHLRSATSKAGLSLGDRACLALAARDDLPAWTTDRNWSKVADDIGVSVVLVR